jgi:uncharacterized membrane protein YtjA (UPF0391 family)
MWPERDPVGPVRHSGTVILLCDRAAFFSSLTVSKKGLRTPLNNSREFSMLHYAVVFFVIALIAAFLGFGGIAAGAAGIAKILFIVFLVMAIVAFLVNGRRNV